ncbi:hypothetical protein [Corallibacter vietnamensis]|uniref:hypothetical protein n=1 Tax=Corallibacter vietnamensis TaxID=904130 RepID=UPI0031D15926
MKRLLILLFTLATLFSCSVGDDSPNTYMEILPVESASLPDEFERGEVYEISLTYLRVSNCHTFSDIYYTKEANKRTVAIVSTVFVNNENCISNNDELETSFNFEVTNSDSYIFKFWQGEDEYGEDQYLIVEVPVVD